MKSTKLVTRNFLIFFIRFFIRCCISCCISLCVLFAPISFAKTIPVQVSLDSIEVVKTNEKGEDELFFDVTLYSNKREAKTYRVPKAPLHWLSNQLKEVKNVVLWEDVVLEDEELKIIISLVEEDTVPWDVNDLIGSAMLILENKNNTLQSHWELPAFEYRVAQEMLETSNPQRFVMRGDNSHYNVSLKVDEKK